MRRQGPIRPNDEQFAVLEAVANRIKHEMRQEQSEGRVVADDTEPMLDLIHGFPGTGKSEVIKWLQSLFKLIG